MARWYCEDIEYSQISDREKKIRDNIVMIMEEYKTDMSDDCYGPPNYGISKKLF